MNQALSPDAGDRSRGDRVADPLAGAWLDHVPELGQRAAQAPFLEGVKSLHSFQFDEAAVAFQRAQQADTTFAMAYWGEAMSHNHPLWAQQDEKAAKAILEKIAPTSEARQAKAKLPARDMACSDALAAMHAQWPGYSAAKLGDLATAERAVAMLRGAREKAEGGANPYSGRSSAILEKQVSAP